MSAVLTVMGGFILLASRQKAVNIDHIAALRVDGREDPHGARTVLLIADMAAGPESSQTLGQFLTFTDAEANLVALAAEIGRAS